MSIELRGGLGSSGFYELMAEHNTFERGQTDEFLIRTLGVGEVFEVCVRSDGSGPAPAWHLQEVTVTSDEHPPPSSDGGGNSTTPAVAIFPAFRWLSTSAGLEAVLKVQPQPESRPLVPGPLCSRLLEAVRDVDVCHPNVC